MSYYKTKHLRNSEDALMNRSRFLNKYRKEKTEGTKTLCLKLLIKI